MTRDAARRQTTRGVAAPIAGDAAVRAVAEAAPGEREEADAAAIGGLATAVNADR